MSVITGLWLKDGGKLDSEALSALGEQTKRYAPDGGTTFANDSIWMMYQALHTHERCFSATGVVPGDLGTVLALDGRIDNYEELCDKLELSRHETSDEEIVLAGYLKWGIDSLVQLVGDWSLSLWDESKKTLCLARDHAGTRTLYYADTPKFTIWSTFPEPILAYTDAQELNREYLERYLAAVPTGDLTPYLGIKTVPAGCYLLIQSSGSIKCVEHWGPLVKEKLHYQRDEDYQEEFLSLFFQAVKRRTGGRGVLAHLSGGVDSSSIVCVADQVSMRSETVPSIATISFYDDEEPDWDERPFFISVEEYRDVKGFHFNASVASRDFVPSPAFYPFPGSDNSHYEREKNFARDSALSRFRVILAGHGGDELLGGPPDPRPELSDAIMSLSFHELFRSSFDWALSKRVPLISLLVDTVKFIGNSYPCLRQPTVKPPAWLKDRLVVNRDLRCRRRTLGYRPSAVGIANDWVRLLETLPHQSLEYEKRFEYRYPYLDRDLVEFLFRVPSSQLLRPGRRRYMMRAALRGIVPDAVLERRRKASISRGLIRALERQREELILLLTHSKLGDMNLISSENAIEVLASPASSWCDNVPLILRLVNMEIWLHQATARNTLGYGPKVA